MGKPNYDSKMFCTYLDGDKAWLLIEQKVMGYDVNLDTLYPEHFLTEITSNLATTAMILPVLVPLAAILNVHPYFLMVGATVAASCAFMLPVATPPNAVVFGSGYLKIGDMVRKGIWMNIVSIILLTLLVYYFLPHIWDLK